jgi:O-antigen/teichoic acid export membrane protein
MSTGRIFSLFSTSLLGIFFVLMGIIIAIHPETINIVTIAFGVYMILNSVIQLSIASRIRGTNAYNTALVTNVIGLVCGIIMIIHPGASNEAVIVLAGILLIVYGASGLVDTFILKSKIDAVKENVKKASKTAKTLIDDVKEAEIVEDKDDKKDEKDDEKSSDKKSSKK